MSDEFPKWVVPDPSHVVNQGGRKSTPGWATSNVDRLTSVVTVLVNDEDEEASAITPRQEIKPEDLHKPVDHSLDAIKASVRAQVAKVAAAKDAEARKARQAKLAEIEQAEIARRVLASKASEEAEQQAIADLAAKVAAVSEEHDL